MADSYRHLIDDLFAPILTLVAELSRATTEAEAIGIYAGDCEHHWFRVGESLRDLNKKPLPECDLQAAIKTITDIDAGTRSQCNTYPQVAVYIFKRLKPLKEAAERGWTAAKHEGNIPPDPFPVDAAQALKFIESVRDEVHYAAEAKRQQLAQGYSNDTLASMVRGIKWAEAGQQVALLSDVPADVVKMVATELQKELTVGTLEQIDESLTRVLRMLRQTWESASILTNGTAVEPPELTMLKGWVALDGIKGHWEHFINAAKFWHLEVDSRHRNIAFLLEKVIGGDPAEVTIRDYLFQTRGILPSEPINVVKLEQFLKEDAERVRGSSSEDADANDSELNARSHSGPAADVPTTKKPKRSTDRGEGRAKLIAALTKHHKYADDGCLNREPVGNNELAQLASVSISTASEFFKWAFSGRESYKRLCNDAAAIGFQLKRLRNELTPAEEHQLYTDAMEVAVRAAKADEGD